jgi:GxxExxY protein
MRSLPNGREGCCTRLNPLPFFETTKAKINRQDAKENLIEPDEITDQLARDLIAAAIEVHRTLGPGFLEQIYEEALVIELRARKIDVKKQVPIAIAYKSAVIGESRLDMLIENRLIVELKAVENILPVHLAQVLSYLKATKLRLGLLINFNVALLREGIKRIVLS